MQTALRPCLLEKAEYIAKRYEAAHLKNALCVKKKDIWQI